jgi:hypothetical protein
MNKELKHANPIIFPKDKKGVQVKIGDKVKGFGFITFQDGFKIDRTPIVTANIQNERLYFGNLSYESFTTGFEIINS